MTLSAILIFATVCAGWRLAARERGLGWFALAGSVLAVFVLQPSTPVRWMDYALPALTLALTALTWALTVPRESLAEHRKENWMAGALLLAGPVWVGLARWLGLGELSAWGLALPRAPQPLPTLLGLLLAAGLAWLATRVPERTRPALWVGGLALLLGLFVALKTPALAAWVSAAWRAAAGQSTALARAGDLRWLGYSYVAFRLIHVLRDRQSGRLPPTTLREFATYVLFFPAFTAGPIDRLERFTRDLRAPAAFNAVEAGEAGRRLAWGLLKKFVLADALALAALNAETAAQARPGWWLWGMLYAYAAMIYLDFSGYTDIAIGLGRLLGVKLPENFNAPYLKPNLTQFWNNWHITLTMWFRAYFFNPVTRWLRQPGRALPATAVMLGTQVATMLLIGLWHGVTWNFVIWGVWQGVGLFAQNRWSEWVKPRAKRWAARPAGQRWLYGAGVFLTFHYVALGWLWFALPTPELAFETLLKLFGWGGL